MGRQGSTRIGTQPHPGHVPTNEFVVAAGMFTAVEFAFVAQRHMHMYGTKPEQLAMVSATIRNNGHVNPEAVYYRTRPVSA